MEHPGDPHRQFGSAVARARKAAREARELSQRLQQVIEGAREGTRTARAQDALDSIRTRVRFSNDLRRLANARRTLEDIKRRTRETDTEE